MRSASAVIDGLSAWSRDLGRAGVSLRRPATLLRAAADPSVWAISLLRARQIGRATVGSALGTSLLLRVAFHIDVWTDDIGPGLRLPHPFGVVIGDGVRIGEDCTLMHNVTIQRGADTLIDDGAVLATGTTVLAGVRVGRGALIGAASVVSRDVPPGQVAVGSPARPVRKTLPGEALR